MKVIAFDSWIGGSKNFARLISPLSDLGIRFFVVHIESWSGSTISPEIVVDGALYRDVSYYGKLDPLDIISLEMPDLVLFLSTDTFAHRAVNRYCHFHHIPTIHLYHGLLSVQSLVPGLPQFKTGLSWLFFVLARIPKALFFIWPLYVKSLLLTKASRYDWWRFLSDIIVMSTGRLVAKAAPDARTSRCLVYADADIPYALSHNGYRVTDVCTVGNPDFDRFGFLEDDICSYSPKTKHPADIIYIDTGLIYGGFVFSSISHFARYLLSLGDVLSVQDFNLKIKLHPDHSKSGADAGMKSLGLHILAESSFRDALKSAEAVIVEPTTLAFLPCALGMPVLLAAFGPLACQRYGEFFTTYPRARLMTEVDQVTSLIHDCKSVSSSMVTQWCLDNVGFPSQGGMPFRVAKNIESLVLGKTQFR
jgi:hypothetical protein